RYLSRGIPRAMASTERDGRARRRPSLCQCGRGPQQPGARRARGDPFLGRRGRPVTLEIMKASVAVFVAVLATVVSADTKLSKQQADAFSRKVFAIAAQAEKDQKRPITRTQVTEGELNSWMAYGAQPLIPKGVTEPSVSILGSGRLSGRAIVDLDAVSKQK